MVKSFTKAEGETEINSDMENLDAYAAFGQFVAKVAEDVPWNHVVLLQDPTFIQVDKNSTTITYEITYRLRAEVPRGEE